MKDLLAMIVVLTAGAIISLPIVWALSWAAELWTRLIGGGRSDR